MFKYILLILLPVFAHASTSVNVAASMNYPSYEEVIMADKPILYLRMNEGADKSIIKDWSNNGFDGTTGNSPDLNQAGPLLSQHGASIGFGANKNVSVPHNTTLNITSNYTFSWWFREDTAGNYVAFEKGSANRLIVFATADADTIWVGHDLTVFEPITWADDIWHHYFVTQDGTNITLYDDGSLFGTGADASGTANTDDFICGYQAAGVLVYPGLLGEIAVWDRQLCEARSKRQFDSALWKVAPGDYCGNGAGEVTAQIALADDLGANDEDAEAASISLTLTTGVAAGLLVTVGIGGDEADDVTSVTDSQGNTYTQAEEQGGGGERAEQWYSIITTPLVATNVITANYGSDSGDRRIHAASWSGVNQASPLDRTAGNNAKGDPAVSGTTAVTIQANELAVGTLQCKTTVANIVGPLDSYTALTTAGSGAQDPVLWTQYLILSTAGAQQSRTDLTGGKTYTYVIATYKANGGL